MYVETSKYQVDLLRHYWMTYMLVNELNGQTSSSLSESGTSIAGDIWLLLFPVLESALLGCILPSDTIMIRKNYYKCEHASVRGVAGEFLKGA